MQVHYDLSSLPVFHNAAITTGTFDGVHSGHIRIIKQLKEEAKKAGGETVIITFHPHPRKIVHREQTPLKVLTTLNEKIELLEASGVDHLVIIPFDEKFANQTAEKYVKNFLFEKFHPHTVIIGYDHRFGKNRTGDYHLMEKFGASLGFEVKEIPGRILNNVVISSTRIREALLHKDISTANTFLGYDYFFEGKVIEGNKMGRTIGYPTANLQNEDEEKLVPGNGVYAVEVQLQFNNVYSGARLKGMMNIGFRPTIGGTKLTIEVNIFDFDEDLYGKSIRVYLKHYLRGEKKFNDLEELKMQLGNDREQATKKLEH